MGKIKFLLSAFILLLSLVAAAQNRDIKEEAEYYFDLKDYKKAYELYDKLCAQSPKNFEYKFRLGYCCLYYSDKKARAIEIFEDIKRTDKSPETDYYLAKAYHINYKFDLAITSYKAFLATKGQKVKLDDKPFVEDAKLGIMNCNNGKELISKKIVADIKNIGGPINTNETQGVPVISADESMMIYTYIGKKSTGGLLNDMLQPDPVEGAYRLDIFMATRLNDSTWNEPMGIKSLNTNANDAAVALSPDGQVLFTFVSDVKNPGDLYTSSLVGSEWSKPEKLNSNINSEYWEGSCSITADGKYLYFASERPGGMGGRDLYVSEKINGDWGPAQNLGPTINTKYNEDAPFIHPDGITLFLSSQGHKSIGGYDIMYSIKKDNKWIEPLSMGIPLNTTADDRYYVINAKGDVGYFSSNRSGSGSKGDEDIYTVTPGMLGEKPILALLKGSVYVDDNPTEAKIDITRKETEESIGPYYANSKTGKYLMAISPGYGYKIKITVANMDPIEEEIDIEKLQKFVEVRKDFYVYSAGFENKKNQISVKTIMDSLLNVPASVDAFKNDAVLRTLVPDSSFVESTIVEQQTPDPNKSEPNTPEPNTPESKVPEPKAQVAKTTTPTNTQSVVKEVKPVKSVESKMPCDGSPMPDLSAFKGKSLNNVQVYRQLIDFIGNICVEDVVFKVQIAAYKKPENYKYSHLKQFGPPEIRDYPDGITRFTQLSFATLREAEKARQEIIGKGQKDAWITVFIDGKRFTLEEIILANFNADVIN